ncbi:MAG: efflux RND transporter periplasmic adaptor subunit [Patescibacteria group bacterium]
MIGFIRKATKRQKLIFGGIAGLILIIGILALSKGNGVSGEIFVVKKGTLTQVVSVTGKTQAVSNVELSFEKAGRVASIPVKVGDRVRAGQVLASLESGELRASLADALANVDVQKAKLDELLIGSRPEDISIKESELAKDKQDLVNYYGSVLNVSNDAFNKADDALRQQLDALFTNDENLNPSLSFEISSSQFKTNIESRRLGLGIELNEWSKKIGRLGPISNETELDEILVFGNSYLSKLQSFLNDIFQGLNSSVALSASTLETYKGNVDTARANISTALSTLTGKIQNISAQKIVVQKAQYQLDLEKAGSTKEQIAAQSAQVKQAKAKTQVIQAQINQNIIFAPFAGLVAKQDLEIGEVAAANVTFISLISDDKLEVEANVPEVSIGKVAVGNLAKIKLDAFSDEIFEGRVGYVEPAETLVEGVVNYKIKVIFDKADKRIRTGLTADIDITTLTKENVLMIPSFAIQENEDGSFTVNQKEDREAVLVEIEVGVRGSDGSVEIISGLREDDEIVVDLE